MAAVRINPGNIGGPDKVEQVVTAAKKAGIAMRIGANSGSLPKHLYSLAQQDQAEALVAAAMEEVELLEKLDYRDFKISVKATHVPTMIRAYRMLAAKVPYPLHLGVTEAGTEFAGGIKSAVGIGTLLADGIGDTLRVSLSAEPEEEVHVGWEMLKSLGIRHRGVKIISCPSCARQGFNVIETVATLEERLAHIETPLSLSIIGCVVNGPGEAMMTDIGVTGGGNRRHMVYNAGKTDHTVDGQSMVEHIVELVEAKARIIQAELDAAKAAAKQAAE